MQNKILTFLLLLATFNVYGQKKNISADETLKFINEKLNPKFVADLKAGMVIIQYFNEKGQLFRVDKGDTENLAFGDISFDETESMLVIPCKGEKCIDRRLVLKKEGGEYARISIKIDDPTKAPGLMKAFAHLIHSAEDVHYKNDEPFE